MKYLRGVYQVDSELTTLLTFFSQMPNSSRVDMLQNCGYNYALIMYTNRRELVNTVGIKQLRGNLSRILKMVENGEVVTVLRHGREVVKLKPVEKNREKELLARLRDKQLSQGGAGKIGTVQTVKNRKPEMPVSDLIIQERR